MVTLAASESCGCFLTVNVYEAADRFEIKLEGAASSTQSDGWGRPVGPTGVRLSVVDSGQAFFLPRFQFDSWFENVSGNLWRPKPTHFGLQFGNAVRLTRVHPYVPFGEMRPGGVIVAGETEEGALVFNSETLAVARYRHDKRERGMLLLPEYQRDDYRFVSPITSPRDDLPTDVGITCYLARSRQRFTAHRMNDTKGRRTMFGDPALAGDYLVIPLQGDPQPFVVPFGLYSKWYTEPDAAGVAVKICEAFALQFDTPFEIHVRGRAQRGSERDFLVTEYDPRGIVAPQLVCEAELDEDYELLITDG